jgi:uncharacterized protein (DUF697 family)
MADDLPPSEQIIRHYMYWAMGAGLIPAPLIDVAAILAIQLKLVAALADHYHKDFRKDAGKAFVGALVGGSLPTAAAGPVASLVKTIPLVGQLAGAVTMPALAGASTYATGRVFVQHFENGGTFDTFDPETARPDYEEQFKKARTVSRRPPAAK